MKILLETVFGVVFSVVHALLLALPVMWLTAFLLSWIIDGAGTTRRAIEAARS